MKNVIIIIIIFACIARFPVLFAVSDYISASA
jgi:hypothetical protein